MFSFFYTVLLSLYGLALLPGLLIGHNRRPLATWFGKGAPPEGSAGRGPVVWVHAPSLGETRAIAPLVKRIRERHPDSTILFTTVTATGQEEAKRNLTACDCVFYLPFDFPLIVRPLVKRVRPNIVIICETDLWYHFLKSAKDAGARVLVVNAKVSERSHRRLKRVPWLANNLYKQIDLFCAQDETYAERFADLGVPPSQLLVTGNLKWDADPIAVPEETLDSLRQRLHITHSNRVIVIGSTHEPEERQLLTALLPLLEREPQLKLLVVPRHPERFDKVAEIIESLGVAWGRYSRSEELKGEERILLFDTMGLLRTCYALSDVAVVGGSFASHVGGHNVMEPLLCDVPVVFGPHMHNQQQMAELLTRTQAGLQVPLEAVQDNLERLLRHQSELVAAKEAGKRLIASTRGSLDRTYEKVEAILSELRPGL